MKEKRKPSADRAIEENPGKNLKLSTAIQAIVDENDEEGELSDPEWQAPDPMQEKYSKNKLISYGSHLT